MEVEASSSDLLPDMGGGTLCFCDLALTCPSESWKFAKRGQENGALIETG